MAKSEIESSARERQAGRKHSWELVLLIVILLLGALLRVLYLEEIRKNPDFDHPAIDAGYHDYWARGLVTGIWSPPGGREDPQIYRYPFYRPPGYAYFLAFVYWVFGLNYLWPRILQMGLGLGSVLLAYFLAGRWFDAIVGLLFGLSMAAYWIFIYFEGELVGVTLAVFLSLLTLFALARWSEKITFSRSISLGLILGVFALFRPNILSFYPVALAWMLWVLGRGRRVRSLPVAGLGLLLGAAVIIMPVTARNYLVSGEFVPIATNLGVSLAVANNEYSDGTTHFIPQIGDIGTPYDYPRIVRYLEWRQGRPLSHTEASRHLVGIATRFMREHPGDFLRLLGRKALLFWGPVEIRNLKEVHFARKNSPLLRVIPANFPLVSALAVTGILLLFLQIRVGWKEGREQRRLRKRFEAAVLIVLFIGSYFISLLPFAAAARYRVPIIPFLLLLGACGVRRIGSFISRGEWKKVVLWTSLGAGLYFLFAINYTGFEPSPAKWHFDLALAYTDRQEWEEAIREYRESIKFQPDSIRAYNNLGFIYSLRGKYEEAVECYSRLLALRPNLAPVLSNLGEALYKLGRTEEALGYYRKALRYRPDLVQAHNNLARALVKLGKFDLAIEHCKKAIEYKPRSMAAHINLSHALAGQGKYEEALSCVEAALRLDPNFLPAQHGREELLRRIKLMLGT